MKNIFLYSCIIILFFTNCEDVINVPLETANPKLVIDANLKWLPNTTGQNQTIKLSLTNHFYSNDVLPANNAIVTIQNGSNEVYNFNQVTGTTDYVCNNFVPLIGETYTLKIIYQGDIYTARNTLLSTPKITEINQENEKGINGKDQIRIKGFFQDNGNEKNYYLFKIDNNRIPFPEYRLLDDKFSQGKLMFGLFYNKIEANDKIKISIQSITEQHFYYMNKLLSISGQNGGGPFSTPPVSLRGNIINETQNERYPFGYFNLSVLSSEDYIVK
ncbi:MULTISPECIES: DUF4249 domain-containing protein [Flavobacterium]|uniref:DUF4249 domain-containing protein n=2 Tax=Flavobacterium TaxID=237 RepID=A0A2N9PAI3_9FLAO|nr:MULTISPECIES: DUF4249 domain-containing protein [Flavobacterium]QYS88552.1 DUF4249 domain-containing protein [Flavobacterium davisii]RVU91988.1 DUF4249 domain-containing protein [Flavobacterium columnare]SPE77374.1 hypothetical protein FLACOL_01367 [Flavobacterium columnare]